MKDSSLRIYCSSSEAFFIQFLALIINYLNLLALEVCNASGEGRRTLCSRVASKLRPKSRSARTYPSAKRSAITCAAPVPLCPLGTVKRNTSRYLVTQVRTLLRNQSQFRTVQKSKGLIMKERKELKFGLNLLAHVLDRVLLFIF